MNSDIYFASGVIACRELLSNSKLSEIKNAKNMESLKAVLSDTPYGDLNFERVKRELFEDLKKLAPQLYDFFFYRYECHDHKIAFRMIDGQLTKEEALSIVFSGSIDALTSSEIIKKAMENKDVALELIDRHYMEKIYEEYKKTDVVREILEIEADYANTRSYLRLGRIDNRIFIPFGKKIRELKLTELEKNLENEIGEKMESYPYKYMNIGFEPVFRHFYRKMREMDFVRETYLLRRAGL